MLPAWNARRKRVYRDRNKVVARGEDLDVGLLLSDSPANLLDKRLDKMLTREMHPRAAVPFVQKMA